MTQQQIASYMEYTTIMKNSEKVESMRLKVLLAVLCLFVGIAVFVYYSKNYNIVKEPSTDIKMYENVENVREIFRDIHQIIGDSAESDNNNWTHQKYQKKLCDLDKTSINKLRNYNVSLNQSDEIKNNAQYDQEFFHDFIQNPQHSFCKQLKEFGGHYNSFCKYFTGQKLVCTDDFIKDIAKGECLIYSFGVANDWSFEDFMDALECKVYVFDGSVKHPEKRGKNIHFENIFIGPENIETKNMQTIPTILARYGHSKRKISYMKLDIEHNEIKILPNALKKGALTNVQQIGMELRLNDDAKRSNNLIRLLKRLYFKGNYRLISYDLNGCIENVAKTALNLLPSEGYYHLVEIVLKKITDNDTCV